MVLKQASHANAEWRVTTIRRWLQDSKVNVWNFYQPVLDHVLFGWRTTKATVIWDGIEVYGGRIQILFLKEMCRGLFKRSCESTGDCLLKGFYLLPLPVSGRVPGG